MNLSQSVAFSEMRRHGLPIAKRETKRRSQIMDRLGVDGLTSEEFILMDVPLHFASTPHLANDVNAVQAEMRAAADTECRVVVDLNTKKIGKLSTGYAPPVIVLHGQAAVQAARLVGRETIRMWIGRLAAQKLNLIHADHQLGNTELRQKLQVELDKKYGVDETDGQLGAKRLYIREVYPLG